MLELIDIECQENMFDVLRHFPAKSTTQLNACIEFEENLLLVFSSSEKFDDLYAVAINGKPNFLREDTEDSSNKWLTSDSDPGYTRTAVLIKKNSWVNLPLHAIRIMYSSGFFQEFDAEFKPYLEIKISDFEAIWATHGILIQTLLEENFDAQHPLLLTADRFKFRLTSDGITNEKKEKSTNIVGHLDTISKNTLLGWVWNANEPSLSQVVEILHEGEVITQGVANTQRLDLLALGYGDGCYGFNLSLPLSVRDGVPRTFTARVKNEHYPLIGKLTYQSDEIYSRFYDPIPHCVVRMLASEIALCSSISEDRNFRWDESAFVVQQINRMIDHGCYLDAVRKIQQLPIRIQEAPLLKCLLGQCCLLQGKVSEAKAQYGSVISLAPSFLWGHLGLSNCYSIQTNWEEAENTLRRVLHIDNSSCLLKRRLVEILKKSNIDKAHALLNSGHLEDSLTLLKNLLMEYFDDQEIRDLMLRALKEVSKKEKVNHLTLPSELVTIYDELRLFDAVLNEVETR